jgi:hypothetical protein
LPEQLRDMRQIVPVDQIFVFFKPCMVGQASSQ